VCDGWQTETRETGLCVVRKDSVMGRCWLLLMLTQKSTVMLMDRYLALAQCQTTHAHSRSVIVHSHSCIFSHDTSSLLLGFNTFNTSSAA